MADYHSHLEEYSKMLGKARDSNRDRVIEDKLESTNTFDLDDNIGIVFIQVI